jgi:hypothetical protein
LQLPYGCFVHLEGKRNQYSSTKNSGRVKAAAAEDAKTDGNNETKTAVSNLLA